MTRYFFHLHNDIDVEDEEGRQLASIELARDEARLAARDMAAESVRGGVLDLRHYVEVGNDTGEMLFRVTFGDVVEIAGQ